MLPKTGKHSGAVIYFLCVLINSGRIMSYRKTVLVEIKLVKQGDENSIRCAAVLIIAGQSWLADLTWRTPVVADLSLVDLS